MTDFQSTPAPGSGQFVSGDTLSLITPLEDFLDNAQEYVAEAIEEARYLAAAELREYALRDPQWSEFADILDVEYEGGEFHYVLNTDDDERRQAAMDLEYGTEANAPRSLLRKVAKHQSQVVSNFVTNALIAEVGLDG